MQVFKSSLFARAISGVSILLIGLQPMMAQTIEATGGTSVVTAPNGLEVVNITAPNSAGVSHNEYTHFNVPAAGVILNNTADEFVSTNLAGQIYGNPNIAGGTQARVIVNEVTAANPSQMRGFIEVAGGRADVVIANPYGITCDGCGFINTDRATLTTGTPQYVGGALERFHVTGGTIAFEGAGANAMDANRFDILSRQVTIAGSINGQRINLVAGRNDVIYATSQVIELADDGSAKPAMGVDSTIVGGMYANVITLTSTEDGVGVTAPQNMAASAGEMVLTADGRLVLKSASATGGSVTATANDIDVQTSLASDQDIRLTSAGEILLAADAQIVAQSQAILSSASATMNAGAKVTSQSGSIFTTTGTMTLGGATLSSAGDLTFNAATINMAAANTLSATGALSIAANQVLGTGTQALAGTTFTAIGRDTALALTGGQYEAKDGATITAASFDAQLNVTAGDANFSGADLTLGGLTAAQNITAQATGALSTSATLQTPGALSLSASNLTHAGTLNSTADAVTLAATTLSNTGVIFGKTGVTSTGNLTNAGQITSDAAITLTGDTTTQNGSEIIAATQLKLIADYVSNAGTLASKTDATVLEAVWNITNTGLIYGATDLSLKANGTLTNDGGTLLSAKGLTLEGLTTSRAAAITNTAGGLIETFDGDIRLAAGTITNERAAPTVTTTAGAPIYLRGGSNDSPPAGVVSNYTIDYQIIHTDSYVHNGDPSKIIAAGNLSLDAGTITNQYSLISANGDIAITGGDLKNIGLSLIEKDETQTQYRARVGVCTFRGWNGKCWRKRVDDVQRGAPTSTYTYSTIGNVFGTLEAGGTVNGTLTGMLVTGAVTTGAATSGSGSNPNINNAAPSDSSITSLTATLSGLEDSALGNSSLFVLNQDPTATTLFETRFEFIDLDSFLSSDYFFNASGLDPSQFTLRLGDSYAETLYIREQLFELTGERLLGENIDERAQMQAMYDNAINETQALTLTPGVALSPDQIAALTTDIIWLEEQVIQGQEVLVPRVYLADATTLRQERGGAQIAAANIDLTVDDISNGGALIASNTLNLDVKGDLNNVGGTLFAGDLLTATVTGDLTSISGRISGTDVALSAQEITIETAKTRIGTGQNFFEAAGVQSTVEALGDLTLTATGDVTFVGAQVDAGTDLAIAAGGDLTVGALELNSQSRGAQNGGSYAAEFTSYEVSSIEVGGDASLTAQGGNLTLEGTQAKIEGALNLSADAGAVALLAVADESYTDISYSGRRFMGSYSGRSQSYSLTNQATSLDAGLINIQAKDDIFAQGAEFASSDASIALRTEDGNLRFEAVTDVSASSNYYTDSSMFGLFGSTSNTRSLKADARGTQATSEQSVTLAAGKDIVLTSVDITAAEDILVGANGSVNLLSAVDISSSYSETSSKGMFQGGGGSFVSIYGGSSTTTQQQSQTVDPSTLLADQNVTITSAGEFISEATYIGAGNDISIASDETILVTGLTQTSSFSETTDKWGLGFAFSNTDSSASLFVGAQETADASTRTITDIVGSRFVAGRNLSASADGDIDVYGSDLVVGAVALDETGEDIVASGLGGKVNLTSQEGTVDIAALTGTTSQTYSSRTARLGVTFTASSSTLAGANQVADAADSFGEGQGNLSGVNDASQTMKAVDGLADISRNISAYAEAKAPELLSDQPADSTSGSGSQLTPEGQLAGFGLSAGFGFNQSTSSGRVDTSFVVGSNVTAFAANDGTSGDIAVTSPDDVTLTASTLYAQGDIDLVAGDDVDLLSAAASRSSSNKSQSSNASVGFDLLANSLVPSFSVGGANASGTGSSATNIAARVRSEGTLTMTSGDDTSVIGAQASARELVVNTGGDLTVASVQSTSTSQQSGSRFNGTVGSNGVSVGFGTTDAQADAQWTNDQAALIGDARADISVGERTQIDGAIVGSQADGGLSLTTGTIGFSNLADRDTARDNSVDVSVAVGSEGFDLNPITGELYNHSRTQDTNATLIGGDVTITDEAAQDALVASGATADIALINTDLDQAQVLTRDEVNAAELYVSPKAVEEISQTFPTIKAAIDNTADLLMVVNSDLGQAMRDGDIDYANALRTLAACRANGGQTQTSSFWDFHWLVAPAYAGAPDCVIERIGGGDPIVVSETESCLRILVRGTATLLISGQAKIDMGKGMLVGMGQEAEMLVEMAANPKETLKQVIMAVDAMLDDPSQAMQDIANGYIDQIANIMIGLESGDYEMVGRELGGLSVNVVVSLATSGAGVAVAGAKALNTAVKAMRARVVKDRGGDLDGPPLTATNRTSAWEGVDTTSRGVGADVPGNIAGWVKGPDGSSIPIQKTPNGQPDWKRFLQDNAEVTSISGNVDSSSVRFTQSDISGNFSDGRSVDDLVTGLRNGTIDPASLPPIRTFEVNGQLYSLDNRRLHAYQQSGIDVPTLPATAAQIRRDSFKFTTPNGGQDIVVRGR